MSKHTPGPYTTFEENGIIDIIGPDGFHIASIEGDNENDRANGELLAAAPDLLEALRESIRYSPYRGESEETPFLRMARAAIAKAGGV